MLNEPQPVFSPCYTEGTLRGYRAGWASWRRHHAGEPPTADQVNDETLKQFIAPLLAKGLRLSTIETYLHGVIAAYNSCSAHAQIGELQQYDWWLDILRAHRDHRRAIKSLWQPRSASNTQQARDMALIALSDAGMTPSALSALHSADLARLLPSLTTDREPIEAWIEATKAVANNESAPAFPTRTGRRWSRRAIHMHLQALRRTETIRGA